jgi:hypothetical protein
MRTAPVMVALLALGAAPLHAEKLSKEFKASFEQAFRPGWTHAVVVQKGIPTTSIYGVKGDQQNAHFSVDCQSGGWKTSQGLLDSDQVAADALELGEVMELASISYKDNRVDLRLVSLAVHKVTRGEWPSQETKREPVATNFKFFLPYPKTQALGPADMPQVIAFIEQYLRPFPDEAGAEAFSARLKLSGEAPAAAPAPAARAAAPKKEIEKGMTALQVIEILGKPEREVSFESKTRWTYPDITVIFESGRVSEVRF